MLTISTHSSSVITTPHTNNFSNTSLIHVADSIYSFVFTYSTPHLHNNLINIYYPLLLIIDDFSQTSSPSQYFYHDYSSPLTQNDIISSVFQLFVTPLTALPCFSNSNTGRQYYTALTTTFPFLTTHKQLDHKPSTFHNAIH